jgi:(p)ppGpp synthase/HD superfamily hydrolase
LPDLLNPRLLDALNYAIELHGRDARKKTQVPVLAHLLSVCALVQQDGVILKRFESSDVCRLVQLCTDTPPDYAGGPKPPWRERKEWYLGQVRKESPKNLRVTVADKVDNLRAILADYRRIGESLWDRFNAPKGDQLWFYQAALDAYKEAGFNGPLLEEMDRLVTELVRVTA